MKTCAFGRPLELEQVPIPTPGPGELLVKIVATGFRHTDLHAADGDSPPRPEIRRGWPPSPRATR
jgi:alcohol dehydrogenase, propanol-preferring